VTSWIDEARRQFGKGLNLIGFGPQETPHRVVAEFPGARLRAYGGADGHERPVLLIIPAPFKRAYIWDLLPEVSVVRHCLRRGLDVYLIEWLTPTEREDGFGLAEYADGLPAAALDAIAAETGCRTPLLAGHSLGGTFAAIFASLWPERVGGLVLLDAPLAFGARGGPLARAVAAVPHARMIRGAAGTPVPGSVINALSAAAAPEAFRVQPTMDLAASLLDPAALAIHLRVARWAYDEFPLPGQLFEDVLEQLYRDDRLLQGTLQVGARRTGIANLRARGMAVVNPVGGVVPPRSVLDGLAAAPAASFTVLEYERDPGPMIQHLGPLAARSAHAQLWPKILDWAVGVGGVRTEPES
jgi:polyhydroxyalkanoate synthase subunit PhaC